YPSPQSPYSSFVIVTLLLCLLSRLLSSFLSFFFFNDPATTEIYTLSLHDALPIFQAALEVSPLLLIGALLALALAWAFRTTRWGDRKSTRLNSSHVKISYAVFCLKKKKKKKQEIKKIKKIQNKNREI